MNLNKLTYCEINQEGATIENELFLEFNEDSLETFLKSIYKKLNLDYSKFYKMDALCKLGFLGVELMKVKHPHLFKTETDEFAVVLFNEYSSLDTDTLHQEAVNKKTPSPATFVYTLPNIVIGEISIRNKWYGESAFFVEGNVSQCITEKYLQVLKHKQKAKFAIFGLVDCFKDNFKCNLALYDLR